MTTTMTTTIRDGGTTVRVEGPCQVTGIAYHVDVPLEGWRRWQRGELIQRALPDVSPDDREFLISGTSPLGWQVLFPPGEDES